LAALKEREKGIDAHCISPNFLQVMGFPEWEHLSFYRSREFEFYKDKKERIFVDPGWFHSGTWGDIFESFELSNSIKFCASQDVSLSSKIFDLFWIKYRRTFKKLVPIRFRAFVVGTLLQRVRESLFDSVQFNSLIHSFDFVTLYGPYVSLAKYFKEKDYIAFEHGTLRDFIHAPYALSQDCKTGFKSARAVICTNQDSYKIAKELGLQNIFSSPHPMIDGNTKRILETRGSNLNQTTNVFRILVPARHTIPLNIDVGKGSHIIYEAINSFAEEHENIIFELVAWGDNFRQAKNDLKHLEKSGKVVWHDLMSRPLLSEKMLEVNVVIDQLSIPAYGGITTDSLKLGVPVITRHDCDLDMSFFGSCAPVFSAANVFEVIDNLNRVFSMTKSQDIIHSHSSSQWFIDNMSSERSHETRLACYKVLGGN
jgi:hypothetical protein